MMVESSDHSRLGLLRQGARPRSWRTLSVSQDASLSPRLRLIILAPLALFLVWEVITRSVVAYLAGANPDMAVRLRSDYPTALLNLAYDRLSSDPSAKSIEPAAPLPRDGSSRLTVVGKGPLGPKPFPRTALPRVLPTRTLWLRSALGWNELYSRTLSMRAPFASLVSSREEHQKRRLCKLPLAARYWRARLSFG